jgi:hypothetical protein
MRTLDLDIQIGIWRNDSESRNDLILALSKLAGNSARRLRRVSVTQVLAR